jgi:uncharacterized membrane protein
MLWKVTISSANPLNEYPQKPKKNSIVSYPLRLSAAAPTLLVSAVKSPGTPHPVSHIRIDGVSTRLIPYRTSQNRCTGPRHQITHPHFVFIFESILISFWVSLPDANSHLWTSTMEKLLTAGRICFALGIAGLGLQQFLYPGFRPVFVPGWFQLLANSQPLVYLFSILLIIASGCILFNVKAKSALLILAVVFLLSFLLLHIPSNLAQNLISPGAWTNALKILAFSGGALILAGSFDDDESVKPSALNRTLGKLIPLGRFFFGVMLIVFGIDHFLYAQFVATLVPAWIGGNIFWTYVAAIALIGSGVSLITKIKISLVSLLMGTMIFIWFLVLHIPRAIAMPDVDNGNELTSVFQALAFSGVGFVLSYVYGNNPQPVIT